MQQTSAAAEKQKQVALLFSAFVIAICGLIYELIAGTLSSYLLGDSVYHFSLVIGIFMSAMGVGAWLSRFIDNHLPDMFIRLQLIIALIGGFSAALLYAAFAIINNYTPLLFLITFSLGALLGIEIPLIIRILKDQFTLKTNLSNVFTVDYIGALFASLLFPLLLVPQLGLIRTGLTFGLINAAIGLLAWYVFRYELKTRTPLLISLILVSMLLISGFFVTSHFVNHIEHKLYQDTIIHAETTPYQRIVLTHRKQRIRFYINGALQFDSFDEYRYHESLVHPAMLTAHAHENILVLGGGDGLAIREILKYDDVEHITLVDLDPAITQLFSYNNALTKLNKNALSNKRLSIINQDAWKFLEHNQQLYDVIIIDLPDPNNISLSRLYSKSFYHLVKQHLSASGAMVTQAASPLYTREAYWSIYQSIASIHEHQSWVVRAYHSYIPSFGEWGFILASRMNTNWAQQTPTIPLQYLKPAIMQTMHIFAADMAKIKVEANDLQNHRLVDYYEKGWKHWYQ
jgi:spermidine synthase